jgi:hypothetical protein
MQGLILTRSISQTTLSAILILVSLTGCNRLTRTSSGLPSGKATVVAPRTATPETSAGASLPESGGESVAPAPAQTPPALPPNGTSAPQGGVSTSNRPTAATTTAETKPSTPSPEKVKPASADHSAAVLPAASSTAIARSTTTGRVPEPAAPRVAEPPTLDLASLEQRLKDTRAIGVFTKLSLKNQVDDLLGQFRAYYRGDTKLSLADLRERYNLLLLKVLTLLQDTDAPLAAAISSSRDAIWAILADPNKFAKL